jgi:hypothetical protein
MGLYTANLNSIISPLAVITLCSVAFFFSMVDILVEVCFYVPDVGGSE